MAPGAKGLSVESGTGVQTDWRGYAIKPYVSAYRENRIALDTKTLDDDTDIEGAVSRVVPTKGAVVKARFVTRHGVRVLMTLTMMVNLYLWEVRSPTATLPESLATTDWFTCPVCRLTAY
ncbi:Outer membrane usher protein fimD precursor [Tatumella ptyseos]|uniref:Outer membrane usher protein fimD n=1 Tax=Tatumella ptyseos TaxID=82987 RepID=A0A2X5NQV2_9GAMM|nr:fimbria/pilus outer membrane usher protein [Tatumella ptyseos]SQK75938.1 Outer membrane usher protein fimD precursor [Tatumella ptyseos]